MTDILSLFKTLISLGYDEREVTVYLSLLELGEATAQAIAEHAKIERTGVYDVLRRLKTTGLVSEIIRDRIHRFLAEPPRRLEERLTEQLTKIKSVLPILESRYNRHAIKPTIRFYDGIEGLKTVLEDTLTAPDHKLLGLLSVYDLFDVIGEESMEAYVKRRIALKVDLRVIRSKTKEVGERWPTNKQEFRSLRYAPKDVIITMTEYIYGSKVAFLSSRDEQFGLVIESNEFANHQRLLFETLWQLSKPNQNE